MQLNSDTKINDLLTTYDFMLDFLVGFSTKYKLLKNPVARNTVGRLATLAQAASIGGMSTGEFIEKTATEIRRRTGETVVVQTATGSSATPITEPAAKHEMLKAIIRRLHDGGDIAEAKRQFAELVKDVDASEIAAMEQKLIQEGLPQEEVKRLCDVHVVEKILNEFKAGTKDVAEFWIRLHDRFIHIRYFALRGDADAYKGCLEVTQDITNIVTLEGEKRLLDWEK